MKYYRLVLGLAPYLLLYFTFTILWSILHDFVIGGLCPEGACDYGSKHFHYKYIMIYVGVTSCTCLQTHEFHIVLSGTALNHFLRSQ